MTTKIQKDIFKGSVGLLSIIYLVGLVGFSTDFTKLMTSLTPLNLLVTFAFLLVNHKGWGLRWLLFLTIAFLIGYGVEVIGVKTGFPFGDYSYGSTLGFSIAGVPLLIGVNWFVLTYGSSELAGAFTTNRWTRSVLGGILMLAFDLTLEPIAVKLDFWSWKDGIIPIANYIGWFVVSFGLQWIYLLLTDGRSQRFARFVFVLQWVFFAILFWMLK